MIIDTQKYPGPLEIDRINSFKYKRFRFQAKQGEILDSIILNAITAQAIGRVDHVHYLSYNTEIRYYDFGKPGYNTIYLKKDESQEFKEAFAPWEL